MARRKKKKRFNKKEAVTFHVVHRSQRDPLAADSEASQLVLVPDTRTAKKLAKAQQERESAVFGDAVMTTEDFAKVNAAAEEGAEWVYEYEYYSDDEDGPGPGPSDPAAAAAAAAAVPKTVDGRVDVAHINPTLDADVDGSVVDNYAYSAYFGHGKDDYDYTQHLRTAAMDGMFMPAPGFMGPPIADITVFKPTVDPTPSALAEAAGLPADVLASTFEEDVGLLNLAAPMPEGFRTDLPIDVMQALEDEDEFEELQDDFIQIAQAAEPLVDGEDGFEDTEWALEYQRVMEPAKYQEKMMSRSEIGYGGGFGFGYGSSDDDGYTVASAARSLVPVYGTPHSVASTVARPRPGMLEVEDEQLEVMMEKTYADDQIGELLADLGAARNTMKIEELDHIIDEVLAGKVLRKDFKKQILLEPIKDAKDLHAAILNAAARQDQEDATTEDPLAQDVIDQAALEQAVGYTPKPTGPQLDVVSVLSLNSNVSNHPRKIKPRAVPKSSKIITLGKGGIPDLPPRHLDSNDNAAEVSPDAYELVPLEGAKRPKNESKADKRARKKTVKAARRAARERKKATKLAFKAEKQSMVRNSIPVDGTTAKGVSVIKY